MSKNRHQYNNDFNKHMQEPVVSNEIVEEKKTMVVDNCELLNVRKEPEATAEILAVISKGTVVEIDEERSSEDFFSVIANGVSGFCMKQFLQ